ncbi:MAG: 50S ribosomal protein L16 [Nitrosopumilus sp.]|nr:50S ribosomal protein L16 [Nitrosopumilus sp.]MDH3489840.1 50S ribosomal protein L16 [Nitrosopumilus sp.]MDH3516663.1 50S ribosomal protein L16 [Nitrosopumilus sp.]MDH3564671.1 50S ribosomal protein L16 [Nitrosopumilus sp.]MDH5554033.1 50S ribosomal protein L16 [Nitrosopumilus sp.]
MHGANYREGRGQVFTRKEYIKGKPQIKIAKFQGGKRAIYEHCVQLLLKEKLQIRHMAIESARLAANKTLEKTTGELGYYSRLRIYPHNLLRENKQIATAGADRVSEGMRRSWGKATSLGARVKQGQCIMEMFVNGDAHVQAARKALQGACVKLPGTPLIKVIEWKKISP